MLAAGIITGIIGYIRDFSLITFLWVLLASLIVFYILGAAAAKVILRFEKANKEAEEKEKAEEGAVIEKEAVPEDIQNLPEGKQNTPETTQEASEAETEDEEA